MNRPAKFALLGAALLVVLAALLFLSGSLLPVLGGARGLDIDGVARAHGAGASAGGEGWGHYGGDAGGARYSAADEITPENVRKLTVAWEHRTGDMARPIDLRRRSASEGTPILVDDKLVFCTPFNEVIALDPGTGAEKWRYDPAIDLDQRPANQFICRGVAYWHDKAAPAGAASAARIFMGTTDTRLVALDAASGKPCEDFGAGGVVRIDPGMDVVWPGEFHMTSPPVVINDTVIIGSAISDNARVIAPSGAVRAYEAASGAPKWIFDPIPRDPGAANAGDWRGGQPPREGHANVWAPMSVDEKRGLVFLPTTSPSPDFFGGLRPGDNRYADSVVALDGETGAVVWSFQAVHHDVWDYDLPAQPGLYTVWRDGEAHDVVAQVTKTGHVFVLDRDTGAPFLPIEERPVPQDGVDGEALSPTQPFPVATPPLVPDRVSPGDAFGLTWLDKNYCRKAIAGLRADGLFTPPTLQGTLIYPSNAGGANWGGAAYDERRNLLVVNMSNIAHNVQLIRAEDVEAVREIYHDTEVSPQAGAPYGMKREVLLSPLGLPCTPPPWGVIAGVDLDSGDIVWRKRLGTTEDLANGLALDLGTPNVGGPIVTASGLIFIGAAMDDYLRAFDVETGEELWKGRLPAGGQATPMTYEWRGRQYVVIYAGGQARMHTTLGDSVVAFALPAR
jgi:quinoprotein glucose dehydrogenase